MGNESEVNEVNSITNERKIYIEILRIVACFFVLYNHTDGYELLIRAEYNTKMLIYMFTALFTRFNVPVFFMISGCVLLGREESISDLYRKRFVRIVMLLFACSLVQYIRLNVPKGDTGIGDFIIKILCNGIEGTATYWYLYSYLSFLLVLPFLRMLVRGMNDKLYIFLLVLHFVFCSLIPIIEFLTGGFFININAPIAVEQFIFYPLIGFWLGHIDQKRITLKGCTILTTLAVIGIAVEMLMTIISGSSGNYSQDYVKVFDYTIAIALFYIARYVTSEIQITKQIEKLICFFGGLTLGIYMLDPILKEYLLRIINFDRFGAYYGSLAYCIFALFIYGVVVSVFKMIPGVKKVV